MPFPHSPVSPCGSCGSPEPFCGCRGRDQHDDTPDIFEGSHAEFAASESYVSPGERAWLKWAAKVEKLLGHSLDGNQDRDGFSLDFANDVFNNNETPESYVAEIKASPLYKAPAKFSSGDLVSWSPVHTAAAVPAEIVEAVTVTAHEPPASRGYIIRINDPWRGHPRGWRTVAYADRLVLRKAVRT